MKRRAAGLLRRVIAGAAVCVLAVQMSACRAPQPSAAGVESSRRETAAMDAYYLPTCASCGTRLGIRGEAVEALSPEGQRRFCRAACRDAFEAEGPAARARLEAVMIADQRPHYPTRASLVTGRALGPAPAAFIWGNRLFLASDSGERNVILADPVRFMRELDRAVIAGKTATYGMPMKCPVQGDILHGDAVIDLVIANRMVRVCCARCEAMVRSRPYQYLAIVDYANREKARVGSDPHDD